MKLYDLFETSKKDPDSTDLMISVIKKLSLEVDRLELENKMSQERIQELEDVIAKIAHRSELCKSSSSGRKYISFSSFWDDDRYFETIKEALKLEDETDEQ